MAEALAASIRRDSEIKWNSGVDFVRWSVELDSLVEVKQIWNNWLTNIEEHVIFASKESVAKHKKGYFIFELLLKFFGESELPDEVERVMAHLSVGFEASHIVLILDFQVLPYPDCRVRQVVSRDYISLSIEIELIVRVRNAERSHVFRDKRVWEIPLLDFICLVEQNEAIFHLDFRVYVPLELLHKSESIVILKKRVPSSHHQVICVGKQEKVKR